MTKELIVMKNKVDKIDDFLSIFPHTCYYNSKKDHLITTCPFCDKNKHFYINIQKLFIIEDGDYRPSWDCKKCSMKGNLSFLLKRLNRLDFLQSLENVVEGFGKHLLILPFLEVGENIKKVDDVLYNKEIRLPMGYRRIFENDYLKYRGFAEEDFLSYPVGVTNLFPKLRNFVVFPVFCGGVISGYFSRSVDVKKTRGIRYLNSEADFANLLYGIDEVNFSTETVILVEGFFDKKKIDEIFDLRNCEHTKCCVTFSKVFSPHQQNLLLSKGVKNIIIAFDSDAIDDIKSIGVSIKRRFEKVFVSCFFGENDFGEKGDWDSIKISQVIDAFDKITEIDYFLTEKVGQTLKF